MEFRLDYVVVKPSDFKICKCCGQLNWYENDFCINCGCENFDESEESVRKWTQDEYDYWQKEEGLSEEEADGILINA